MTAPRGTALLVLGMHRSGTSAFARVLNLLGADLPTALVPAAFDNRLGHWEPLELVALHDEILASAGTSWDDWTRFDPTWYDSLFAARCRERLVAHLTQDFAASALFVIKDPRICRLVRLWREACAEFGAHVKVVIALRNPLEVAQSLERRDGFPPAKSHLLWLRHTLDALQDSRDLARCVVSYDALLRDWRDTAATISRRLGVSWSRSSPATDAEIDAFLTHEERHHVVTRDEVLEHPVLGEWVKRAYRTLLAMSDSADAPSAHADLDELAGQLDAASAVFTPLLRAQERALTDERTTAAARLAESDARASALEGRLRQLTAELAEMRGQLDEARAEARRWEARGLSVSGSLRPAPDLSAQLGPAFQDLLDDSYLFLGITAGDRLLPSDDLQRVGALTYRLRLDRPNLSGLLLAPLVDLPGGSGSLGIEVSMPDGIAVARARVALAEIDPGRPVRFAFPPVPGSAHIGLRVDVRDATTPVRLLEWRPRRFLGLGRLAPRPFCALIYGD
jgi:hypothetical protein